MKRNGFTLVELLAVIVILGVIVIIATSNVGSIMRHSKMNTFKNDAVVLTEAGLNKYADNKMLAESCEDSVYCEDLYRGAYPGKKCYSVKKLIDLKYATTGNDQLKGSVEVCYGTDCTYDAKIWLSNGTYNIKAVTHDGLKTISNSHLKDSSNAYNSTFEKCGNN